MESWILVMLVYAGVMAKGDSVALQTITGFDNKANADDAADEVHHAFARLLERAHGIGA